MRHVLLAAVCLVLLSVGCAGMPGVGPSDGTEPLWIDTSDHWKLALHRYPARNRQVPPIILLPDVYENAAAYDLDQSHSLARALASDGYDVTVAELRGQGQSERPAWWNDRRADWTFDIYVERDLPAIVTAVRRERTADKVLLGGHGFGGLAAIAFAEAHPEQVAGLVGIGTAGKLAKLNELHRAVLTKTDRLDWIEEVPTREGATAAAPFVGTRETLFDLLLCNGRRLRRTTIEAYYRRALEPVSIGVARQIAGWLQHGVWTAYDSSIDYLASLSKVTCPTVLLSGAIDNLVDPADSRDLLDRLGSADKTHRIFGAINGYADDYGHAALLIGERAMSEVGDYLDNWLASRNWR